MFGTWRRSLSVCEVRLIAGRIAMPYGDGPGADGLSDNDDLSGHDDGSHPDYDVNLDDAGGDNGDDPPLRQPAAPAGRQPVQNPRPGTPGTSGPDSGTPQSYTSDQYNQVVTGYRTLESQNQQLHGQLQHMQRQIAALTGAAPPPAADPSQPPMSEADQKAIKAVYRLFPQLKPLLEKAQDILSLPETVNGFKSAEQARWQDTGVRMWEAFDGAVKATYGEQKLHPFAQKSLDSAFVSWLETDQNAAARYRMGDVRLAAEFMTMYRNGVIRPAQAARPGTGTAGPRRPGQQQQQRGLPRGGAGGTGTSQRPAQPNVQSADELHGAAADAYFAARS